MRLVGPESYLDHLEGLTPQAREQLQAEVDRMLERLVREVQRVEFAERHDQLEAPEITATMVMRAASVLQPTALRPRPPRMVALHALNLACAAAAGVLTGRLDGLWQWALLGVFTGVSVAASSYLYRRRWQ